MASTFLVKGTKILVPAVLIAIAGMLVASVLMAPPRKPPAMLGASATLSGGLARINGVIPTEVDGWLPPSPSKALTNPPGEGWHRVRLLLEVTALEPGGLSFDPTDYTVSALGKGTWNAQWASLGPTTARQGESINAILIFELPDQAIDLTLEVPGGPGLSLGAGHHRGST
jgi:hypothetical protein